GVLWLGRRGHGSSFGSVGSVGSVGSAGSVGSGRGRGGRGRSCQDLPHGGDERRIGGLGGLPRHGQPGIAHRTGGGAADADDRGRVVHAERGGAARDHRAGQDQRAETTGGQALTHGGRRIDRLGAV